MSQNGKGDKRRPTQVDFDTYASNWDRVFSKKGKQTPPKECKIWITRDCGARNTDVRLWTAKPVYVEADVFSGWVDDSISGRTIGTRYNSVFVNFSPPRDMIDPSMCGSEAIVELICYRS